MLDPTRLLHPAIERCGVRIRTRDQRIETADAFSPFKREQPIFDAQHRWRVDRLALENPINQLARFGQPKDLGQRPRRGVALESFDCARAEYEHAVRCFAAERLLPTEGADIDLLP